MRKNNFGSEIIIFMGESDFAKKVYAVLRRVPRGQTISYQDLAKLAGRPRAYRAAGNILHKNPYAPAVPCHRVVRSDGRIGGFAGGEKKKIRLLRGEGVIIKDGKIKQTGKYLIK